MGFERVDRRRVIKALAALPVVAGAVGRAPAVGAAQVEPVTGERAYKAYVPAALKEGQFFQYTCEFDAAWAVLKTFGYDVPFPEQLAIVGHDRSVEPWYELTPAGYVVYGGDITAAFSGDYKGNLLARATGPAMAPLFATFGLAVEPVGTKRGVMATLQDGGLVWIKATVDFLPWEPVIWITPDGSELPGVLGNDHAVIVMGYDAEVVVIRDVLGPTSSNWNRAYEYEVPWATFLAVWEAQGFDGLGVLPPAEGAVSAGVAGQG